MCVRWCYLWELTLDSLKNYITLPKFSSAWKQRSMYRDIHRAPLIWCIHLQHTLNALKVYYLTKYKNIFEFVSFLKTELAQVVEIIPHEKPVPIYPAHSVLLLLLSWRCREPGQPKPWFGQLVWNRVKVVTRNTPIKERLGRHAKYYSEINRVLIIVWSWCRVKYYFVIIEQCWLEYLKRLTKIRTNVSKWHPEQHQYWFLYVFFFAAQSLSLHEIMVSYNHRVAHYNSKIWWLKHSKSIPCGVNARLDRMIQRSCHIKVMKNIDAIDANVIYTDHIVKPTKPLQIAKTILTIWQL